MMNGASPKASLHCLSAFCPPATVIQQWDTLAQKWVSIAFRRSAPRLLGSGNRDTNEQCPVSIAFRRSAPRLPDVPCRYGEPVENCLHCLSAFCPPATGRIERHCGWPIWRLHCLSAFCPPATLIACKNAGYRLLMSPLPFGVLPPGYSILHPATSLV